MSPVILRLCRRACCCHYHPGALRERYQFIALYRPVERTAPGFVFNIESRQDRLPVQAYLPQLFSLLLNGKRMSYPRQVVLREVIDSDLPIFFEHQRDPEAVRMAAFASRDHDAFATHWAKLRGEPSNIIRTIVCDGQVAGNIGSWIAGDRRLIGYWIGREFWGRGVATAALAAFVAEVKERPLHAFVAGHNVGSIRVLEKCNFVLSPEHDTSTAGEDGIHEVLYMLVH